MSPVLDERDPTGRFVRGLTLGALLGAVIAGSSIWTKAKARRAPTGPATGKPPAAPATPTGRQDL